MNVPERLKGIMSTVKGSGGGPGEAWVWWLVILLGSLVVIVLLLRELLRHLRRGEVLREVVSKNRIKGGQLELLRWLTNLRWERDPMEVLARPEAFEKGVDLYFERLGSIPMADGEAERVSRVVNGLRENLGFAFRAGMEIVSSRQIPKGTRVRLGVQGHDAMVGMEGRIVSDRQDVLVVQTRDVPPAWIAGKEAAVVVMSGDRMLFFPSQVLDLRRDSKKCLLAHSLRVRRMPDRRRWKRVPCSAGVAAEVEGKQLMCKLCDLSPGGMKIRLVEDVDVTEGVTIGLRLDWKELLPDGEWPDVMEFRGRVVSVEKDAGGEGMFLHVAFVGVGGEMESELLRLCNRMEIRAVRGRDG